MLNKSKKISSILNLAFKIIVAIGSISYLSYILFYQKKQFVSASDGKVFDLNFSFLKDYLLDVFIKNPSNLLYLMGALALTAFNWGSEVAKWKVLMGKLLHVNNKMAIYSILGGVAASNLTPYHTGSYLGRVAHVPFRYRLRGIAILFIGDTAQLAVTILMGSAALFALIYNSSESLQFFNHQRITLLLLMGGIFIGTILFCIIFLRLKYFSIFLGKFKILQKIKRIWSVFSKLNHRETVIELLAISGFRVLVIILQYYLIFNLFGLKINMLDSLLVTISMFTIYNFLPTFNILELGMTRTGIFILLLQTFISPDLITLNTTLIISCSLFTIWFINLALPTALGSYFLLKVKLFNHH